MKLFLQRLGQVVGFVFLLLGTIALGFTAYVYSRTPLGWGFLIWSCVIGLALVRAGYLAAFRWSPLAVRHLIGTLFLVLWLWIWNRFPDAGLLALAALFVAYRATAFLIIRHQFPLDPPKEISPSTESRS